MDGVVVLLKAPGMTSSNAVYDVRRIFDQKRAGHTGTLDPGAAGVLPICLGRATRLFDYLVDKEKTYIAELALGAATDTQDAAGTVIARARGDFPGQAYRRAAGVHRADRAGRPGVFRAQGQRPQDVRPGARRRGGAGARAHGADL